MDGHRPDIATADRIGVETGVSDISTTDARYRGYRAVELAEICRFEEVAYLLLFGELPDPGQLEEFLALEKSRRGLSDALLATMRKFSRKAHPMDTLKASVAFLAQEDPAAADATPTGLSTKTVRLLAKLPQAIAADHRLRSDAPLVLGDNTIGFAENLLAMMFGAVPAPQVARAFDRTLTLYAEQAFDAPTAAARVVASSGADFYSAFLAALGAAKGPLAAGGAERVSAMLDDAAQAEDVADWLKMRLDHRRTVAGFAVAHGAPASDRVAAMSDVIDVAVGALDTDEARAVREIATRVTEIMAAETGRAPTLDFQIAVAWRIIGVPAPAFGPLLALARLPGWAAHIMEEHGGAAPIGLAASYSGLEPRAVPALKER